MHYIQKAYNYTLEVKQSKFIAHLIPFSDYQTTLEQLKQQHPKARHFVTAYRYLNEYEQVVEHSSDDGEPKGTSGKPSLMVLQGAAMIETAVIIVRYFGGTKLGTGGLVRAYSESVNAVLESAEIREYKKQKEVQISFTYADVRFVEHECEQKGIKIVDKIFEESVIYTLRGVEADMNLLLKSIERVYDLP